LFLDVRSACHNDDAYLPHTVLNLGIVGVGRLEVGRETSRLKRKQLSGKAAPPRNARGERPNSSTHFYNIIILKDIEYRLAN
jgi:hypothetical protein